MDLVDVLCLKAPTSQALSIGLVEPPVWWVALAAPLPKLSTMFLDGIDVVDAPPLPAAYRGMTSAIRQRMGEKEAEKGEEKKKAKVGKQAHDKVEKVDEKNVEVGKQFHDKKKVEKVDEKKVEVGKQSHDKKKVEKLDDEKKVEVGKQSHDNEKVEKLDDEKRVEVGKQSHDKKKVEKLDDEKKVEVDKQSHDKDKVEKLESKKVEVGKQPHEKKKVEKLDGKKVGKQPHEKKKVEKLDEDKVKKKKKVGGLSEIEGKKVHQKVEGMSEGKKVHEKVEGMSVGKKRKAEGRDGEAKQMKVEKPKACVKVKTIEVKKDETSKGKKVIKPRAKNPNTCLNSLPL